jgi:hypothetical protein
MDDSQQSQQPTDPAYQSQSNQAVSPQPSDKKEEISVPVSAPSKEGGPAISIPEKFVAPSVPEMEVSPDLQKETGIESKTETPQLTPEDAKAGIVHAKESVPVSVTPTATIVLPMTQQQSQQTVKLHKKVKDSLFWFAMLVMRQWQIAQKDKTSPRLEQNYGETKKEAA